MSHRFRVFTLPIDAAWCMHRSSVPMDLLELYEYSPIRSSLYCDRCTRVQKSWLILLVVYRFALDYLLYFRTRINLSLDKSQREPIVRFLNRWLSSFPRISRSFIRVSSAPRHRRSQNSLGFFRGGECYGILTSSIAARYPDRGHFGSSLLVFRSFVHYFFLTILISLDPDYKCEWKQLALISDHNKQI